MDYGKQYLKKFSLLAAMTVSLNVVLSFGFWILSSKLFADDVILLISFWLLLSGSILAYSTRLLALASYKPISRLSDAVVYAGHSSRGGVAPNTESLRIGKELVTSLALQVYDLASMSSQSSDISMYAKSDNIPTVITSKDHISSENSDTALNSQYSVLDKINFPIIGIDSLQKVTTINRCALEYLNVTLEKSIGTAIYDIAKLSFEDDNTFEKWLQHVQQKVVNADHTWERVRIVNPEGQALKQFDLVASFSKQTGANTETIIALFDRTDKYSRDDQEISFVAMAVHELRTPLTIMRGYIEVFEDEIGPQLTPELTGFMHKMHASAEQLTAFVGNILNVARVEENQLVLKLQKHDWSEILKAAVNDLALRAGVHGKHIELHIAGDIPPIAVDQISIHEVINNLVDNAIKYSGGSDKIVISSVVNQDGLVETSVQDFGIGIPSAVMPDLFQKFYRSHKSRIQIGGTGLGLFLCKSIVNAHDGNIWVRSKEGEGSIFTFTLHPFDEMKHEQTSGEDGIMRGAHGWIKNHTLNRQ